MKKFKIKENTTLEEIEDELKRIYSSNVVEIELGDIIKIAQYLGCIYHGGTGGSQVRFSHPAIKTFKNFFGVHIIHGRKVETVKRIDFKAYLYKHLISIIESKRADK
ncbi:MAG: hypothetical protein WC126_09410 [Proteiniphilum sp.]|jgi:hypothetical protein